MTGPHRDFLPIVLGTFILVTGYALANDQWVAAIAPGHFSMFDPHFFPFDEAWQQGLCFAVVGAGGPALAWGVLLYWMGHYGPGPMMGRRATLLGVAGVLALTAMLAWGLAWYAAATGKPVYPKYFYPTDETAIFVSQTAQLTNFVVGLGGAIVWLGGIYVWRWKNDPSAQ